MLDRPSIGTNHGPQIASGTRYISLARGLSRSRRPLCCMSLEHPPWCWAVSESFSNAQQLVLWRATNLVGRAKI